MGETFLAWVVLAEAALLSTALLILVGHAAATSIRHRRESPRLATAATTLAAALEGEASESHVLDELAGLPARAQISVFANLGQSLSGIQKQRLAGLAAEVGLVRRAERWCHSRRWGKRLRGARVLTLLGVGDREVGPLLEDPRAEVRAQAAQWVEGHPEPESIERLLTMLGDPETLCRFTVKNSLVSIGRASADPLLRYMSNIHGAPAREALEVAAGIADARFLTPALAQCRAADPATRSVAAALTGAVGGSQAGDALIGLLADADANVRTSAAKALGRLAYWPASGKLAACLPDRDWYVRRASAVALNAMGAAGVLLLRRALTDSDRFARDVARQVLELSGEQTVARPTGDSPPDRRPLREVSFDEVLFDETVSRWRDRHPELSEEQAARAVESFVGARQAKPVADREPVAA